MYRRCGFLRNVVESVSLSSSVATLRCASGSVPSVCGVIAISAAALACSHRRSAATTGAWATDTPQRDSSPIQTDSLVYHLRELPDRYDAYAIAVYTNRTSDSVYFARCTSDATEPITRLRRTGPDTTIGILGGIDWACVGGVPTGTVPPGGTLETRVWLGSSKSPHAVPPDRPEERVGRFRIEFRLCARFAADSDECDVLPREARQSNEFNVVF